MTSAASTLVLAAIIIGLILLARFGRVGQKITMYTILLVVAFIMVFPFYDMLVMATSATTELRSATPPLFFGTSAQENFSRMTQSVNIPLAFRNSLMISGSFTALSLLFCSIGGYAFAMYRFPGRNILFALLLGTMMVPQAATTIPWYIMMSRFGWVNNPLALIIPGCASAFGIFWMRQYCFNNVPRELLDAARIDGCPEWQIFFRVVAPILKPAYATLGIMCFVGSWNDFMNPLLILKDASLRTLPLMLRYLVGDPRRGTDMGPLLMANAFVVLPLLIVFLIASRQFISGLTAGAIKE